MSEPGKADGASGPWSGRRLHFVGVGGAGMSGYARAAHALGAEVSGSDAAAGAYVERLAADGVLQASIGHAAANVPAGDDVELVYSSAVPAENPERAAARERGIPERPRAELLAELTALRRTIAVAGTHGKTTTASMLVHALRGGRPGSRLAGRRLGRRRAGERGLGERRVARRRGRRVRPLDAQPERRDRRADERRARPPRDVRLAGASCARPSAAFLAGPPHAVVWDRPELLELRAGPRRARLRRRGGDPDAPGARASAGAARRCAWRCPARTTRSTPPPRCEAARLAGAEAAPAIAGLAGFHGAGRRFQLLGHTRAGRGRVRRLRAPPDRGRGDARRRAHARARGGWWRCSSRTCTRARRCSAREFGRALAHADVDGRARRLSGARARRGSSRGERPADRRGDGGRRGAGGRSTGCPRSRTPSPCSRGCSRTATCAW